jgi:hypothetical protein
MRNIFPALLIISTALFFSGISCTKESCDQETDALMNAVFYSSQAEEENEKINIDSLDIYALNITDSLIYSMVTLSEVALPLNPSSSSCSFVFVNGGRADTIDIFYNSSLQLLSMACGYVYFYEIEDIQHTGNDISYISIINKTVNPGEQENIQIYF